jgi:hypothetical protein
MERLMNSETGQEKPSISKGAVIKILDSLKEKYPVLRKAKPLCYTIKEEILAENPQLTPEEIVAVIKRHVKSPKYLQKMLSKMHRYNLKDEKVSEIIEADKAYARFKSQHILPQKKKPEAEVNV